MASRRGRPSIHPTVQIIIRQCRQLGDSGMAIARRTGLSIGTVYKYCNYVIHKRRLNRYRQINTRNGHMLRLLKMRKIVA